MSDGGKGDTPRPISISNEEYASRWDAIFGKDKPDSEIDKITRNNEETQEALLAADKSIDLQAFMARGFAALRKSKTS